MAQNLNRLGRSTIERLLNWAGFATYDHETTEQLRTALREAIDAGDIDADAVEQELAHQKQEAAHG